MARHWRILLETLVVLAASVSAAQAGAVPDDGAPPRDCWSCQGGGPARTAEARLPALRGPLKSAWRFESKGTLEGESLVWGPRVIVSVRDPEGCRSLRLLRLSDGEEVGRREFGAALPLLASVWDGIVLIRSGKKEIQALSLTRDSLSTLWSLEVPAPVRGLLLTERQAWVTTTDAALRYDLGESAPTWTTAGRFLGSPSLRGGHLYLVRSRGKSGCLVALDRRTGRVAGTAVTRDAYPDLSGKIDPCRIAVYGRMVMVHAARGTRSRSTIPAVGFTRKAENGTLSLAFSDSWDLIGDAVRWEEGWFGLVQLHGVGAILAKTFPDGRYYPVTGGKNLAAELRFPTRTGSLVYLGSQATDIATGEVIWTIPGSVKGRIVPLSSRLLVPRGPGVVEALTSRDRSRSLFWTGAGPAPFEGRVVLASGRIVTGAFEWDSEAGRLRDPKKKKHSWPPEEILVALDTKDGVVACGDVGSFPHGLGMLDRARHAAVLADLANRARATKDPALLGKLIFLALVNGATEKDVQPATRRLASIRRAKRPSRPIASKVRAVKAELAKLEAPPSRTFAEVLQVMGPNLPRRLRIGLLRRVLMEDPGDAAALKEVRSLLPKGLDLPDDFKALEWLDFLDVTARIPIKVLTPPKRGELNLPPGRRMLGVLRGTWRSDLIGIESEHLLVLTPVDRPASMARCLSMGELVCDTLGEWFAAGTHDRSTRWPMMLLVHDSREEYLKESGRRLSGGASGLIAESLGHYSPGEELSRLFVPGEESEFFTVMGVFAHELTHQWMDERCPLVGGLDKGKRAFNSGGAGYWIVEGMATLMEQFYFDLEARSVRLRARPVRTLLVAAAPAEHLLPWGTYFGLGHVEFSKLSTKGGHKIPATSFTGATVASGVALFYAQACSVSLYLFDGEGGRHRAKLMEYVGAYYRGESPRVPDSFGMSHEELGKKAHAYVRRLAEK